jgi:hypothetical protein
MTAIVDEAREIAAAPAADGGEARIEGAAVLRATSVPISTCCGRLERKIRVCE